jgi:hypothetical protein
MNFLIVRKHVLKITKFAYDLGVLITSEKWVVKNVGNAIMNGIASCNCVPDMCNEDFFKSRFSCQYNC